MWFKPDASLQNQNLHTDCNGWPNGFTSQLPSLCQSQKVVNFTHTVYSWLAISVSQLALGGQMATNLCQLVYKFELDQSQCERVATPNTSWMQDQTLHWLASTCKSLWPGLYTVWSVHQSDWWSGFLWNQEFIGKAVGDFNEAQK